jgi:hypothetical protein
LSVFPVTWKKLGAQNSRAATCTPIPFRKGVSFCEWNRCAKSTRIAFTARGCHEVPAPDVEVLRGAENYTNISCGFERGDVSSGSSKIYSSWGHSFVR